MSAMLFSAWPAVYGSEADGGQRVERQERLGTDEEEREIPEEEVSQGWKAREKNGLVAWQDFLGDGSAVFSWLFYYISRLSLYDIRSERERGGDGVVLYLLFA